MPFNDFPSLFQDPFKTSPLPFNSQICPLKIFPLFFKKDPFQISPVPFSSQMPFKEFPSLFQDPFFRLPLSPLVPRFPLKTFPLFSRLHCKLEDAFGRHFQFTPPSCMTSRNSSSCLLSYRVVWPLTKRTFFVFFFFLWVERGGGWSPY